MQRFYLVTRGDLTSAQQAVQAAHAALCFAAQFPDTPVALLPLAFLVADDELELCWLAEHAYRDGIAAASFYEPDLGDALTAVALGPAGWRLVRKYPLALQGAQP